MPTRQPLLPRFTFFAALPLCSATGMALALQLQRLVAEGRLNDGFCWGAEICTINAWRQILQVTSSRGYIDRDPPVTFLTRLMMIDGQWTLARDDTGLFKGGTDTPGPFTGKRQITIGGAEAGIASECFRSTCQCHVLTNFFAKFMVVI